MTTTGPVPAPTSAGPAARPLRALLLLDGVGTVLLGAVALLVAEPLSDELGTPLALRVVGVLFLLVGTDMLLVRRSTGARLRAGARVLGGLDLAFAAVAVGALAVADATALGSVLAVAVAVVCLAMGTAKIGLAGR